MYRTAALVLATILVASASANIHHHNELEPIVETGTWNVQGTVNLVKEFEGLYLTAYICPAGVLTIGYGHTGPDVKPGMKITKQ